MPEPIPVICDRCRAEGFTDSEGFADFGDLLEFEPVPRRRRAGGWTPDVQRAFIATLAVTGSDSQAARAVGKAPFGVDQLKKAKGNAGFLAARERALALAAEDQDRRLAAGSAPPSAAPGPLRRSRSGIPPRPRPMPKTPAGSTI